MAGFMPAPSPEAKDKEIALVCSGPITTGHRRVGLVSYHRPLHLASSCRCDIDLAVEEVHRSVVQGLPVSIHLPDRAPVQGFRASSLPLGPEFFQAIIEENRFLSLHIWLPASRHPVSPRRRLDHLNVLACQISAIHRPVTSFRSDAAESFPD